MRNALFPCASEVVVTIVRWWAGVVWLVMGVVGIFWGPIAIAGGDYGGVYLFVGGLTMAVLGWVVHPRGLQRRRRRNRRINSDHDVTARTPAPVFSDVPRASP